MKETLEILVEKVHSGDKKSLETIVLKIKDYVYNLSLKMLLYPEEAEDATQEILIKVIMSINSFTNKSKFMTWVYRIATNYLITYKGKKVKEFTMPFDAYEKLIDTGHSNTVKYTTNEGELFLLEEEVKVSCTQGLLLCLNSVDRMVYVLSEILEFNSIEGAKIMEITSVNFRKKLSRSRTKIRNFLNNKCGLSNPKNPCRCNKKIDYLIEQKIVNPKDLRFAKFSKRSIDLVEKLSGLEKSMAIYRSVAKAEAPQIIFNNLQKALTFD